MKNDKEIKKIIVLDDSYYYNLVLTKQIEHFVDGLKLKNETEFKVDSYLSTNTFFSELKSDTDLVILDFYIEDGTSTLSVLRRIKTKCKKAKIIVISQFRNLNTSVKTLLNGANKFIYKDKNALPKICRSIEELLLNKNY